MMGMYWWNGPRVSEFQLEYAAVYYASIGNAVGFGLIVIAVLCQAVEVNKRGDPGRRWFCGAALMLLVVSVGLIGYRAGVEGSAMRAHFQSLQKNDRARNDVNALLVVVRDELERLKASGGGSPLDLAALSQLVDGRIPADKRALKAGTN